MAGSTSIPVPDLGAGSIGSPGGGRSGVGVAGHPEAGEQGPFHHLVADGEAGLRWTVVAGAGAAWVGHLDIYPPQPGAARRDHIDHQPVTAGLVRRGHLPFPVTDRSAVEREAGWAVQYRSTVIAGYIGSITSSIGSPRSTATSQSRSPIHTPTGRVPVRPFDLPVGSRFTFPPPPREPVVVLGVVPGGERTSKIATPAPGTGPYRRGPGVRRRRQRSPPPPR